MGEAIKKERKLGPAPVVDVRKADGTKSGQVKLDPYVFAIEPHVSVMHQVVTAQLAAARAGTQSTKTRAEVSGGGAKPWRQKGTGRARAGSSRSPIWVGGGIAHGPKPRSYKQSTPKKMVQLALRSALSDRASENRIVVLDDVAFETPSTKGAVAALKAFEVEGKVLMVLGEQDENVYLSFRNLPNVHVVPAPELNTYDVLRSDYVVFTKSTLPGATPEDTAVAAPTRKKAAAKPAAEAASESGEEGAAE